ncbi:MAG TPA: PucR family transcriptional regulator ligand-binding domain-containing protein [Streptosporangiaceae bacterium]|nr:PucR family transcriptional regulator ligand-binding domain-containing protein [Streptosporangiaceae bacterium]
MLLTVADVLALDVVSQGAPKVLAGADRLDAPVRWVHVIELAQASHLLRGGELVLSTGIALPPDPAGLGTYVASLAAAGVSALAVELGSRYVRELPSALVSAAVRHRLPLIVLERETQFIAITEAVHARLLAAQMAELTAADRLYQVFTELAMAGATMQQVVDQASVLSGVPVILADLAHRVLACAPAGRPAADLLSGFAARSRSVLVRGRVRYDHATGWLVGPVGAGVGTGPGDDWGRLIFVLARPPSPADEVLCERAATTLALAAIVRERTREAAAHPERAAAGALFAAVAGPGYADFADLHARITAIGVPLTGHHLMAVAVPKTSPAELTRACEAAGVAAITGRLDDGLTGGLLALPPGADADATLTGVIAGLDQPAVVMGVARPVTSLAEARTAISEAALAAGAAAVIAGVAAGAAGAAAVIAGVIAGAAAFGRPSTDPALDLIPTTQPTPATPAPEPTPAIPATRPASLTSGATPAPLASPASPASAASAASAGPGKAVDGPARLFVRLADLGLAGLLYQLRDDPRVVNYAERELGPLLAHDATAGTDLIRVLAIYLQAGGNKTATAARTGLARPTLYERLHQIEQVTGQPIESPQAQVAFAVALLAYSVAGGTSSGS